MSIAYGVHGSGPPLVKTANWMTHIEHDWESPVWRHWLNGLGAHHTLIRYDERGCGLSDREVGEDAFSFERWLSDLETVVDAAGVDRFALIGISQGAALAVAYAVEHPDRVTHLLLYGGYARARPFRSPGGRAESEMLISVTRIGWGRDNPAFRRLFTTMLLPDGTPEQVAWYDELARISASPETAARIREARAEVEITDLAKRVRTSTLVAHVRDDAAVPFEEGRLLASLIPTARFLPLEGRNHILLEDEPAWPTFLEEAERFLASPEAEAEAVPLPPTGDLSGREREVLGLVADGLTNDEIAERLFLSSRTVERHLSNVYVKLRVSGKSARAAAAARYAQDVRGARSNRA